MSHEELKRLIAEQRPIQQILEDQTVLIDWVINKPAPWVAQ